MTVKTLITHSGAFHADDLFAYAVLSELFPDAELIRTRDMAVISQAEDAIIFDVGGEYDPEKGIFDHHQVDKPLREEGLPYSSFGLIWKHFGLDYVNSVCQWTTNRESAELHRKLDGRIVRDIDAIDNGALQPDQQGLNHPSSIGQMMMDFRPDFDDKRPSAMGDAFLEASREAGNILKRKIRKAGAGLRSEKIVRKSIEGRSHPNWIILPRGMNYMGPIMKFDEAKEIQFVVYPSDGDWHGEWELNAVNVNQRTYELRKALPKEWAGLRGEDMAAASGVPDATFTHSNLFISIAQSYEGIMALLEQALAYEPDASPEVPGP